MIGAKAQIARTTFRITSRDMQPIVKRILGEGVFWVVIGASFGHCYYKHGHEGVLLLGWATLIGFCSASLGAWAFGIVKYLLN